MILSVFFMIHEILCLSFRSFRFFDRRLIFFRCKDEFGYFQLILVCFTLDADLERFLRTCYPVFPRAKIYVTTHAIVRLRILIHFKGASTVSSLPDVLMYDLPYIYSELSSCMYHFPCVTRHYHRYMKIELYYYLFQKPYCK